MSPTRPTRWVREVYFSNSVGGADDFFTTTYFASHAPLDIGETFRRSYCQGAVNIGIEVQEGATPPFMDLFAGFTCRMGVYVDTTSDDLTDPPTFDTGPDDPSFVQQWLLQPGAFGSWPSATGITYQQSYTIPEDGLSNSTTNRGPASGAGANIYLVWKIESAELNFWDLDGSSGITGILFAQFYLHTLIETAAS